TAAVRPHNLKLLINGKRWPITALDGVVRYTDIRAGPQQVGARWTGDARNSGYHVAISTTEPTRVYRRCFTGTSCVLPRRVYVGSGQEMHWVATIVKTRTLTVASGFRVCLTGV